MIYTMIIKNTTNPLSLTVGSIIPVYTWSLKNKIPNTKGFRNVRLSDWNLSMKLLLPMEILAELLEGWRSSYSRYLWQCNIFEWYDEKKQNNKY